jgi:hypothetical protein
MINLIVPASISPALPIVGVCSYGTDSSGKRTKPIAPSAVMFIFIFVKCRESKLCYRIDVPSCVNRSRVQ